MATQLQKQLLNLLKRLDAKGKIDKDKSKIKEQSKEQEHRANHGTKKMEPNKPKALKKKF